MRRGGPYIKQLRRVRRWMSKKTWAEGFSGLTLTERLDYIVEWEAKKKADLMVEHLIKKNDALQFAAWAIAQEVGITPQEFTLDLLVAKVKELAARSK